MHFCSCIFLRGNQTTDTPTVIGKRLSTALGEHTKVPQKHFANDLYPMANPQVFSCTFVKRNITETSSAETPTDVPQLLHRGSSVDWDYELLQG